MSKGETYGGESDRKEGMKGGIEMDGVEKKIRVKKDEQGERDKRKR